MSEKLQLASSYLDGIPAKYRQAVLEGIFGTAIQVATELELEPTAVVPNLKTLNLDVLPQPNSAGQPIISGNIDLTGNQKDRHFWLNFVIDQETNNLLLIPKMGAETLRDSEGNPIIRRLAIE